MYKNMLWSTLPNAQCIETVCWAFGQMKEEIDNRCSRPAIYIRVVWFDTNKQETHTQTRSGGLNHEGGGLLSARRDRA